jgi:hypothetical protein
MVRQKAKRPEQNEKRCELALRHQREADTDEKRNEVPFRTTEKRRVKGVKEETEHSAQAMLTGETSTLQRKVGAARGVCESVTL